MSCRNNRLINRKVETQDASSSISNSIPVTELWLSQLFEHGNEKILVTSIQNKFIIENRIPLQLKYFNNFGQIQLSYRGLKFHDYFPVEATIKLSKLLLKKATSVHEDVHDGDWENIHINTEKESDCRYLFDRAVKDNYIVILAIQFEIINKNNPSSQLTLYPHNLNGTPLHRAVTEKDMEMIKILLEYKLDIDAKNETELTPLLVAIDPGISNISRVLIMRKNLKINFTDKSYRTTQHVPVESTCLPIIKLLLKNKANVNLDDDFGQTVLHFALAKSNIGDNFPIIKLLLKYKADVNWKDATGKTALHVASENPNMTIEIIQFILNHTNDINVKDNFKWTAVHCAAFSNNVNVLEFLLKNNVDVNAKDFKGKTPLHLITNLKNKYRSCFKCIKILIDYKADVNVVDDELISPLHLACLAKNAEAIKYLIKSGADSSMRDKHGRTVFHYVGKISFKQILSHTDNLEENVKDTLNVLVEENISVNCGDKHGSTPLHYVVENYYSTLFKNELFLNIGADINAVNERFNSPFDELIERKMYWGYRSLIALYQKHIIKMKVMKLWVREKSLKTIYKAGSKRHLKSIQLYERPCIREIDLMKSTNFNRSNVTYYDFLKRSLHNAVNCTRNQNIVRAIQSKKLIARFPIYGHFLKCHLREVQRRRNLYDQIQDASKISIFKRLPIVCLYEIFRYLNNSDLNVFCEALKPIVLVK